MIRRTNWKHFLMGFPVVFILLLLVQYGYERTDRLIIDLRQSSHYYEYKSIEFIKKDGDNLVFASTAIIREEHPIFWNDVLRCVDGETYRFYSVQNSDYATPVPTTVFRTVHWNFHEEFPYDTKCFLDSTITMDVKGINKRQKIKSPLFKVEEGNQNNGVKL